MHFLFSAALKDLRRIRNDIWKPVIWAAIPLVIAGLITMATGGSSGVQPTVQLLVADEDDSFLSNFLTGSFGQGEAGKLFHVEKVTSDKGRQILSEGDASALLIIPKGFGADVLKDSPCELLLITNPAQRILPEIAEETVSILVDGSFYAHRILGDEIRQLADGPTDLDNGFSNAEIAKTSVQINQVMQRVTKYINPLAITLESSVDKKKVEDENEEAKSKAKDLPLSFYFFPGTLLMALFFMAEGLSGDLWAERDRGTLRRVSMTPHSMAAFLGGKFVANAIVILLVSLVLLVIGCLYFNRPLSVLPLGLFWMTISGLALLSVLSLLQMLATSQRAAALFTNSLMFPLLMIGGSFFPFEVMPLWMAAIGRLTPNGWILVQLKSIMLQETEIGSFAVATAALVGVFVVFFGSCVVRLSAVRARG